MRVHRHIKAVSVVAISLLFAASCGGSQSVDGHVAAEMPSEVAEASEAPIVVVIVGEPQGGSDELQRQPTTTDGTGDDGEHRSEDDGLALDDLERLHDEEPEFEQSNEDDASVAVTEGSPDAGDRRRERREERERERQRREAELESATAGPPAPALDVASVVLEGLDLDGNCSGALEPVTMDVVEYAVATATLPLSPVAPGTADTDMRAIITITAMQRPGSACAADQTPDGMRLSGIGLGGLMIVRGDTSVAVRSPGDVFGHPDLELVSMLGWDFSSGAWVPTSRPVLAELSYLPPPDPAIAQTCASIDAASAFEFVANAIVAAEFASPAPAAAARASLTTTDLDIVHTADRLLTRWADAPAPAEASSRFGEASAVAAMCAHSPVSMLAAAATLADADFFEDARETLEALLEAGFDDPRIRTLAASYALRSGNEQVAWEEANALADEVPGGPAGLLAARLARVRQSYLDVAEERLHGLVSDEIYGASAAFELGMLYEDFGEWNAARDAYNAASEADPTYPDPENALGCMAFERDDIESARSHFRQALSRDTSFSSAYNNLGFIAEYHDEDYPAAEEFYRSAIDLDPNNASSRYNLGYILERHLGRLSDAAEAYEAALTLDPDHFEASQALSSLRNRPDATLEGLIGTWTASLVDERNDTVTVVATFFEGGNMSFIERGSSGEAHTTHYSYDVVSRDGAQLELQLEQDGTTEPAIVEFLTEDRLVLFHPSSPASSRLLFQRRVGEEMATRDASIIVAMR